MATSNALRAIQDAVDDLSNVLIGAGSQVGLKRSTGELLENIVTPLTKSVINKDPEWQRSMEVRIPMGRLGEVDEVVEAAIRLPRLDSNCQGIA